MKWWSTTNGRLNERIPRINPASENRPETPSNNQREIPACEEDAVTIGTGDFVAGRWSAYRCGPSADDYLGS